MMGEVPQFNPGFIIIGAGVTSHGYVVIGSANVDRAEIVLRQEPLVIDYDNVLSFQDLLPRTTSVKAEMRQFRIAYAPSYAEAFAKLMGSWQEQAAEA